MATSGELVLAGRSGLIGERAEDYQFTSIDTTTVEGKKAVHRATVLSNSGGPMSNGDDMEVKDLLLHAAEWINEDTGEVKKGIRTILIAPDGTQQAYGSDGVVRSIESIIKNFGPPPWNPPLRLKAVEVKTNRGFRTIILDVL